MSPAATEAAQIAKSAAERVVDAYRQAAQTSHEARQLKSIVEDAIEDGADAAKRTVKIVQRRIDDLKDEAVHRLKRQPIRAVGIAAAAGLFFGVAIGWLGGRCALRRGA
jgi:ElaB/YqjD/DUF883 family membrane-anchored ribosome-binding protein